MLFICTAVPSLLAASDSFKITFNVDAGQPQSVTDLVAISSSTLSEGRALLTWTAPSEDPLHISIKTAVVSFEIRAATFSIDSLGGDTTYWWNIATRSEVFPSVKEPGETESKIINNLFTGNTWYFAIKSRDDYPFTSNIDVKAESGAQAYCYLESILLEPITDLAATTNDSADGRIDLEWTSVDGAYYVLKYDERSVEELGGSATSWWNNAANIYSQSWVPAEGGEKETVYGLVGLTAGATYYISIVAGTGAGMVSVGNVAQAVAGLVEDNIVPREPCGIRGQLHADRKSITLSWREVVKNTDRSSSKDLKGYNIYRASLINGKYNLEGFVPAGTLSWTEPEDISGQVLYYMVRSIDTYGNESKCSMIVDSFMNVYATDEKDRLVHMGMSKNINSILYKESNPYGDDIIIEILRNEIEEKDKIIKSYTFMAKKAGNKEVVSNFVFNKPLAQIVLTYEVVNGQVMCAKSVSEDKVEENLALFWFNGLEWIKLGGEINKEFRTVSIKTKRIGKYVIKQSKQATSFSIIGSYPDKIFTPNGDGWNDYFEVICANPRDGNVSGKIYDLHGAFVSGMEKGGSFSMGNVSLKWDGNYSNGKTASGGVYIYQVEISGPENKVINGTVVIAK